ncbi:hypothetical protein TA3x_003019 [Tundrisphaera sp. TA3]|uniref:hypothetical protein n=1 Tax=Tundrisphaera sp. TA3 TaxID=3435775 RepID=UPI003EB6A6CE
MTATMKSLLCVAALGFDASAHGQGPTIDPLKAEVDDLRVRLIRLNDEAEYLRARLERVNAEIAFTDPFKRAFGSENTDPTQWLGMTDSDIERVADRMIWVDQRMREGKFKGYISSDPSPRKAALDDFVRFVRDGKHKHHRAAIEKAKVVEMEKKAIFEKGRVLGD